MGQIRSIFLKNISSDVAVVIVILAAMINL